MIRVGLIGCGKNGYGHFKNLLEIEGAEVCALYDVYPQAAERWVAELDAGTRKPTVVTRLDAMWDLVDAVWVTTPPGTHYENAVQALRAGKHVLVEKPISLQLDQADEMIAIAEEKGLKFLVGYCLRFQPIFSAFRDVASSGRIGELVSVWCNRLGNKPPQPGHWHNDMAMSGGMLIETYTHNIDWMRLVAGDVREVYSKERTIHQGYDFEDHAQGTIEFENGVIGQFFSSWAHSPSRYEWGIIGTKGTATKHDQTTIRIDLHDGTSEMMKVERVSQTLVEDRHFIEAIQHDHPVLFDARDSAKTLEVHFALKLSGTSGAPVSLPVPNRNVHIGAFAPSRRGARKTAGL